MSLLERIIATPEGVWLLIPLLLLAAGLIGRPRPSRPRCRACRAALDKGAVLPSTCPGCRVDLRPTRAVAFGGWRPNVRLLVVLMAIMVLPVVPTTIGLIAGWRLNRAETLAQRQITIAQIESVFAPDAAGRGSAHERHEWLTARLREGAVDSAVRERVVELLVAALATEPRDIQRLLMLELALAERGDARAVFDEFAAALATPTLTVSRHGSTTAIVITEPGDLLAPWVSPQLTPVMAVRAIRIGGRAVTIDRVNPRVMIAGAGVSGELHLSVWESDRKSDEPLEGVEVDLEYGLVRSPPDTLARFGILGPLDRCPDVVVHQRLTLTAP